MINGQSRHCPLSSFAWKRTLLRSLTAAILYGIYSPACIASYLACQRALIVRGVGGAPRRRRLWPFCLPSHSRAVAQSFPKRRPSALQCRACAPFSSFAAGCRNFFEASRTSEGAALPAQRSVSADRLGGRPVAFRRTSVLTLGLTAFHLSLVRFFQASLLHGFIIQPMVFERCAPPLS